jgi:hypothetical protein
MPRHPPRLGRVALRGAIVFAIAFVILITGAGALLAVRLDVGAYRFTSIGPYARGTRPTGMASYDAEFVRGSDGLIHISGRHAPAPPPGIVLGSAEFNTRTTYTGFPHHYRGEWALSVTKVVPSAAGPSASDVSAWNAIVAEGLSRSRSGGRAVPAALRRGGDSGTTFSLRDFAYNAGWRLLHDPVWAGGCFLLAVAIAVAASWRSVAALRRGPDACAMCGYDRGGLAPGSRCPECGADPLAGVASSVS